MGLFLLLLIISIPVVMVTIGAMISGPRYKGPRTDHFDGFKFINPGGVKANGVMELIKWMVNRKQGPWKDKSQEAYGKRPLAHFKGGVRITFVNHSTFLIQVDGVNILTDPVWSTRVSPFHWAGPRRKRRPGIRLEDLPRIHAVLITHNHYDHLDLDTMRTIFGAHHPRIVTPLGVKQFLEGNYISGASDVDWWQEMEISDNLKVRAVPAQHFSGRGLLDRDATLWCGYVIKCSAGNIYYSGDTGYNHSIFSEIRSKCGPMKISMLPIGAYKPTWFMEPIHTSPEQAVQIHLDVGSETSIAMHFGTFPLADDGSDEPVDDLRSAISKHQLREGEFLVLPEGEAIVFE